MGFIAIQEANIKRDHLLCPPDHTAQHRDSQTPGTKAEKTIMKKNNMQMATVFIAAINVGSLVQAFLLPSNPLGPISSASTSCSSPRACGVIMRADQEDGASMIKPMDRKVALQSAVLTLGAALVINPSINVASGVDFSKVITFLYVLERLAMVQVPSWIWTANQTKSTFSPLPNASGIRSPSVRVCPVSSR